jgi:hypothetical protein
VNGNDLCVGDCCESVPHRLCACCASSFDTAHLGQFEFVRQRLKTRRVFGGQNRDYFVDLFTALELPERVNDYRNASQFEKLFRAIAAQPRSLAGSHDYGDIHPLKLRCR